MPGIVEDLAVVVWLGVVAWIVNRGVVEKPNRRIVVMSSGPSVETTARAMRID
jgi:hypothetical protein